MEKELKLTTKDHILGIIANNPGLKIIEILKKIHNFKKITYHGVYKEIKNLIDENKIYKLNSMLYITNIYSNFIKSLNLNNNSERNIKIKNQKIEAYNLIEVDEILSFLFKSKEEGSIKCYTHNIWWPFLKLSENYLNFSNNYNKNTDYTIFSKNKSKLDNWAASFEGLAGHNTIFVEDEIPWDIFLFPNFVVLLEFDFSEIEQIFFKSKGIMDLFKLKFNEKIRVNEKIKIEIITDKDKIKFYNNMISNLKHSKKQNQNQELNN